MKRLLCTVVVLLCACFASAHAVNVVYPDAQRVAAGDRAFFMDRAGDLYPPGNVSVDTDALLDVGQRRPFHRTSSEEYATLRALYRWEWANRSARWQALARHAGVQPETDFDIAWATVQQHLRKQVDAHLEAMKQTQVVLLVHGFNNNFDEATKWYDAVEASIAKSHPGTGVARMYWDGLSANPLVVWGEAQYNGPDVGLGLRRVLNALPANYPLRVFTHSSGAFVMTSALGDGSGAFRAADVDEAYALRGRAAPTYDYPKLTDLRVAMLVPAQPSTAYNAFDGGKYGAVPARLILGTSRRDFATSKVVGFCSVFGATCMATNPDIACDDVRDTLGIDVPRIAVVDFPLRLTWTLTHPHGVQEYMDDTAEWTQLIGSLLDATPATTPGTTKYCKPRA